MKTQLPEKIPSKYYLPATRTQKDYNEIVDCLLEIRNYLKEREEPTPPTPPEPEWKFRDRYFFIADIGEVDASDWIDHSTDLARRDFLGIYRTLEEAEAVLVKIKAVVRK